MPVPFGFGVGDLITVGGVIAKVVQELKDNGEASPEYQQLLLDLGILSGSLSRLQSLKPESRELIHLESIRAAALSCQIPLERFLEKIEKFDPSLGIWHSHSRSVGRFTRRMQWRLMYKDDVRDLQAALGGQIAAISMLLMIQTTESVTAHHNSTDQNSTQILEAIDKQTQHLESCSRSLGGLHVKIDSGNVQHHTLQTYHAEIQEISPKLVEIRDQSSAIQATVHETSQQASTVSQQISSMLSSMTRLLFMITSGMLTLHSLRRKVAELVQSWSTFTAEMRNFTKQTLLVFGQIHEALSRIEEKLPNSIMLPSVFFQDAWGNTMHVPLQICQNFKALHTFIGILFDEKPGRWRIKAGQYVIMRTQTQKKITSPEEINSGDQLTMAVVLPDPLFDRRRCPFPNCGASFPLADNRQSRALLCPECHRWSAVDESQIGEQYEQQDSSRDLEWRLIPRECQTDEEHEREIELYRQIYTRRPIGNQVHVFESRYHTAAALKRILGMIFPGQPWNVTLRRGKFVVSAPRILTQEEINSISRGSTRSAGGQEEIF